YFRSGIYILSLHDALPIFYVPVHKANAGISYSYQDWNIYGEFLYVGEIYTRSDNNSRYNLDAYEVFNLGTDYTFKKDYTLGIKVDRKSTRLNSSHVKISYA